jgi:signal peptidase I
VPEAQPAPFSLGSLGQASLVAQDNAPAGQRDNDSRFRQYVKFPLLVLALVLCLRLLVFDVVRVEGTSMLPTLHHRDSLISNKLVYKLYDPQRYDIIMLDAPDRPGYFIKRVVGLPNERISIIDGRVYINGELLQEEYLDNVSTKGDTDAVIPDGFYFVMGDNRPYSLDSRDKKISTIAREHIYGKAILRFYPFNSFGTL